MPVSRREFLALIATLPALKAGRLARPASSVPVSEILERIGRIRDPAMRAVARASASRYLGVAAGATAREAIADVEALELSNRGSREKISALADIAVTTGDVAFVEEAAAVAASLGKIEDATRAFVRIAETASTVGSRRAVDCVLSWVRRQDPRIATTFLAAVASSFRENPARADFIAAARAACEGVEDAHYLSCGLNALQGLGELVPRSWGPIRRAEELTRSRRRRAGLIERDACDPA